MMKFMLDNGAYSFKKRRIGELIENSTFFDAYVEFTNNNNNQLFTYFIAPDYIPLTNSIGECKKAEKINKRLYVQFFEKISKKRKQQSYVTYHIGESTDHLIWLAENFNNICIGGLVKTHPKQYKPILTFCVPLIKERNPAAKIHLLGIGVTLLNSKRCPEKRIIQEITSMDRAIGLEKQSILPKTENHRRYDVGIRKLTPQRNTIGKGLLDKGYFWNLPEKRKNEIFKTVEAAIPNCKIGKYNEEKEIVELGFCNSGPMCYAVCLYQYTRQLTALVGGNSDFVFFGGYFTSLFTKLLSMLKGKEFDLSEDAKTVINNNGGTLFSFDCFWNKKREEIESSQLKQIELILSYQKENIANLF